LSHAHFRGVLPEQNRSGFGGCALVEPFAINAYVAELAEMLGKHIFADQHREA
jgi:hypothetical protein